jgi:hypothetical protein
MRLLSINPLPDYDRLAQFFGNLTKPMVLALLSVPIHPFITKWYSTCDGFHIDVAELFAAWLKTKVPVTKKFEVYRKAWRFRSDNYSGHVVEYQTPFFIDELVIEPVVRWLTICGMLYQQPIHKFEVPDDTSSEEGIDTPPISPSVAPEAVITKFRRSKFIPVTEILPGRDKFPISYVGNLNDSDQVCQNCGLYLAPAFTLNTKPEGWQHATHNCQIHRINGGFATQSYSTREGRSAVAREFSYYWSHGSGIP